MPTKNGNVILEPKTRIGKHFVEANGVIFEIVKVYMRTSNGVLIKIKSIETGLCCLVDCENDKDYKIKNQ